MRPVGPVPKTSTSLPGRNCRTSRPWTTQATGSARAVASGSRSPAGWHLPAGATTYSAKPPGSVTPMARMLAQNWGRARRHWRQCPQAIMLSSATRSPSARPVTPGPVPLTTPAISCPGVSG